MSEEVAALILSRLPDLAGSDVTLLGEGTDHRVYEVGGAWLLRVPRHPEAGKRLDMEARVLRWLAPRLPLPVPAYEAVGPDFAAYRRLPGAPALDVRQQAPTLGPRLGAFLRALHRADADEAAALGVPRDDDPGLGEWAEEARGDLESAARHGLVSPDHRMMIRSRLTAPPPPSALLPVPIHGDFAAEHVLLDAWGEPCGVIDWSDMILGDVAQDLGGLLHWGGPGLLDAALQTYGPLPEATLERAHVYAICRALGDLVYGQQEGRAEYVRAGQAALGWVLGG